MNYIPSEHIQAYIYIYIYIYIFVGFSYITSRVSLYKYIDICLCVVINIWSIIYFHSCG